MASRAAGVTDGGHFDSWTDMHGEVEISEAGQVGHDLGGVATVAVDDRRDPARSAALGQFFETFDPAMVLALLARLEAAEEAARPPF